MKSENFVVIQGWMCNELELKGNDLLVFALIYGFSQDGESAFHGSRNYIANTFNISKPTVDKALQNLVDKQYIIKYETEDFNAPNAYAVNIQVVKKLYMGSKETLLGGSKETLLNNTSKQTDNIKKNNSKELLQNSPSFEFGKQKSKKDSLYTKCVALIDAFVSIHNCGNPVRRKLISYLNFRLSVKDKPLYINMWKGMLAKLDKLHQEGYGYEPIIDYCLERGYLSFYTPAGCYSDIKEKPWENGVTCEQYTEEELAELEELDRKREEMGMRTKF